MPAADRARETEPSLPVSVRYLERTAAAPVPAAAPSAAPALARGPAPRPHRPVPRAHRPTPAPSPARDSPPASVVPAAPAELAQAVDTPPTVDSAVGEGTPSSAAATMAGGSADADAGGAVDQPASFTAAYLNNPPPPYPPMSRRLGEEGRVIVRVALDALGKVVEIGLERSSGHRRLDRAAVDAVRAWRFEPARSGGRAVAASVLVPVDFRLEQE
ncbi:energy transducer TonB [Pseudothauera lacus]|uniref:Energy transducer TonB n=1 Tax=Pseudothauera lacus TaxID=2136175 RepID=A0A2T4IK63_9RHOO|nr:energy transducer TonB [Pseudothauera lacus]PTD98157.1 energy transducer TonB [Pseudothauera lacus]